MVFSVDRLHEVALMLTRRLALCMLLLYLGGSSWLSTAALAEEAVSVPLPRLIATPEKFDGARVRVIGFVTIEFEGTAIYPHKEDYDYAILGNDVWLSVPRERWAEWTKLSGHYCIVEGTFSATNRGHMGTFSGALDDIRRFELWHDRGRRKKRKS